MHACHSEPFEQPAFGTDRPFQPGPPPRLTANTGEDDQISFTPDGKYLMYSLNRTCIAFLPTGQARDSVWICPQPSDTVSDRYSLPILSPTRRLAFQLARFVSFASGPFYQAVMVAPLADERDTAEVMPVPFVSAVDGMMHDTVTQLAWLRGDTLAVLTDNVVYLTDPASAAFPREFVRLALPGPVASIQPDPTGSSLYVKVLGDARVLRWNKSSGAISTLYDFGADSIASIAVGSRYLAVVTPTHVIRIDLGTSQVRAVPSFGISLNELAMSPDGSDIIGSGMDSSGPPTSDLFRLR